MSEEYSNNITLNCHNEDCRTKNSTFIHKTINGSHYYTCSKCGNRVIVEWVSDTQLEIKQVVINYVM